MKGLQLTNILHEKYQQHWTVLSLRLLWKAVFKNHQLWNSPSELNVFPQRAKINQKLLQLLRNLKKRKSSWWSMWIKEAPGTKSDSATGGSAERFLQARDAHTGRGTRSVLLSNTRMTQRFCRAPQGSAGRLQEGPWILMIPCTQSWAKSTVLKSFFWVQQLQWLRSPSFHFQKP